MTKITEDEARKILSGFTNAAYFSSMRVTARDGHRICFQLDGESYFYSVVHFTTEDDKVLEYAVTANSTETGSCIFFKTVEA